MPDAEPSIAAERRIMSVLEVTVFARRPLSPERPLA